MTVAQFVRVCECGCGQPTRIAQATQTRNGHTKGVPLRFINGHFKRPSKYPSTCSADGCEGVHDSAGYCRKHYARMLRHGNLLGIRPREDEGTRFWMRVNKTAANGCWEWRPAVRLGRYGIFRRDDGSNQGAHRYSYELHYGPIPQHLHVLHACDNPPCVNPQHLSLGTHADNMRDMAEKGRAGSFKVKREGRDERVPAV